jgi:hypothetical protein
MREPGFYWLSDQEHKVHTVAHWDGDFWTFISSPMMISEADDEDDEAKAYLARWTIRQRLLEPAG